jgi:hypothetical protein
MFGNSTLYTQTFNSIDAKQNKEKKSSLRIWILRKNIADFF